VYSDYEADIWGGDAGFPVDREWMEAAQREEEEIQRVEDERLIKKMNDEMNSEFEKEGA
jgi:hypothetical protein